MFKCGVPQHVCWWVNYELILTFQKIFLISFLTWSFEWCIYDAYCPTKMVSNSHNTALYTCFEARSKHWRLPDRRGLAEERPEPHQRRSDHGPKLQMVGGYVSQINLKKKITKNQCWKCWKNIPVTEKGLIRYETCLKNLRFVVLEMLRSHHSYQYFQCHSIHAPFVLQGFRMRLMHTSWARRCTRNGALVRQASCAWATSRDLVCIGIILLLPGLPSFSPIS